MPASLSTLLKLTPSQSGKRRVFSPFKKADQGTLRRWHVVQVRLGVSLGDKYFRNPRPLCHTRLGFVHSTMISLYTDEHNMDTNPASTM